MNGHAMELDEYLILTACALSAIGAVAVTLAAWFERRAGPDT